MRRFLSSSVRVLRVGGFWAAIVLVLPNCDFVPGTLPPNNFHSGSPPRGDLIFCDIERPLGRHCATAEDLVRGIRLSEAAIALAEGRRSDVALDDAPAALAACGGTPMAILFQGAFPDGFPVCVNCGQVIGAAGAYPDVNDACRARCFDFFGELREDGFLIAEVPPAPATIEFCSAVSRASTNFPVTDCFGGACESGVIRTDFVDPRRLPEAVAWTDLIGAAADGPLSNDLRRTAAETGVFDAGAVSAQWITRGDAWFEFSVDPGKSVVAGLSQIPFGCPLPCPDTDPNDASIDFALLVTLDGRVFVQENGTLLPGPVATVGASGRLRVRVRDNGAGTAQVRYTMLMGPCLPGSLCNDAELHLSTMTASYPLRVDTSLFHANARIMDARVVRIH